MIKVKLFLFLLFCICGCNEVISEEKPAVLKMKNAEKELMRQAQIILNSENNTNLEQSNIPLEDDKCDWDNIYEYSVVSSCIGVISIDPLTKFSARDKLKEKFPYNKTAIEYGLIEEFRLNNVDFEEGRLILIAWGKENGSYILKNKKKTLTLDSDDVEVEHILKKNEKGEVYKEIFELGFAGGVTTLSLEKLQDELFLKREVSAD